MKYIDAEKLIAEIERLIKEHKKALNKEDNTLIVEAMLKGSLNAYEHIKHFLSSLQQEQPECVEIKCKLDNASALNSSESVDTSELLFVKQEQPQVADASKMEHEVDLEKEVKDYFMDSGYNLPYYECWTIARHFYELGRNARKEG